MARMNNQHNVVVCLENPKFPGTNGRVIARDVDFGDYMKMRSSGPDGSVDPALRLWVGSAEIGELVSLCGCPAGDCMLCDDAGLLHDSKKDH